MRLLVDAAGMVTIPRDASTLQWKALSRLVQDRRTAGESSLMCRAKTSGCVDTVALIHHLAGDQL